MELQTVVWTGFTGALGLIVLLVSTKFKNLREEIKMAKELASEAKEEIGDVTNNYIERFGKIEVLIGQSQAVIIEKFTEKFDTFRKEVDNTYVRKN